MNASILDRLSNCVKDGNLVFPVMSRANSTFIRPSELKLVGNGIENFGPMHCSIIAIEVG